MEKTIKSNFTKKETTLLIIVICVMSLFAMFNIYVSVKTLIINRLEVFSIGIIYSEVNIYEPEIKADNFLVYTTDTKDIKNNDYVFYISNGDVYLKKVKSIEGEKFYLTNNFETSSTNKSNIIGKYLKGSTIITFVSKIFSSAWGIVLSLFPLVPIIVFVIIRWKMAHSKVVDNP